MASPEILTVTALAHQLKGVLEGAFASVWVEGEISNFTAHGSGHWYFTLKDDGASLSSVMFRGSNQRVRFRPEHGMAVLCRGRISLYPPHGRTQLIVDRMEPRGVGALQAAFEQLRARLEAEGLFDASRKRELPFLPACVGVVTSPTGAALRDVLRVLYERYQPMEVLLAPSRVQGDGAALEVADALDLLNADGRPDVIICGRGGGSLEDLWAFNEETVARAIARSRIPVISAVGHEVDVTIADLVADRRAATPSNAAEIAVPVRAELDAALEELQQRLITAWDRGARRRLEVQQRLRRHLVDPRRYLQIQAQRRDELQGRLDGARQRHAGDLHERLRNLAQRLEAGSPTQRIVTERRNVRAAREALLRSQHHLVALKGASLRQAAGRLNALSPLSVLERGYSITSRDGTPLTAAADVEPGERVDVRLHEGALVCTVDEVEE
jgi:exodeoxyribonuclease VII large subunit